MHTNNGRRPSGAANATKIHEMVARAHGARYPVLVASMIGPDCTDVPAAIAAVRQRRPEWFEPAASAGAASRVAAFA